MTDRQENPFYPNGQCSACGWGLTEHGGCPNPDCEREGDKLPEEAGQTDREDADGQGHYAYFAHQRSFIWSGEATRPIQVCDGYTGAPVTDQFLLGMVAPNLPLPISPATFKWLCDTWLLEEEK